jgi:predicted naringenin-chalcone synthase
LALSPDSTKVRTSYEILQNYGNLSSASTGFMLAENTDRRGPTMVVGFGVGFAASAGMINFG